LIGGGDKIRWVLACDRDGEREFVKSVPEIELDLDVKENGTLNIVLSNSTLMLKRTEPSILYSPEGNFDQIASTSSLVIAILTPKRLNCSHVAAVGWSMMRPRNNATINFFILPPI
jgi:hypothetical protein